MTFRLGRAATNSTAHALADDGEVALCGSTVAVVAGTFPGSGGPVCRDCSRAAVTSGVPMRARGSVKRPGGM
jgi:hypothetical protein